MDDPKKEAADFAGLLKQERTRAGLRQAELAARADLTPAYLSQLESRKKPAPSDDVIHRIATALGCNATPLLETAHLEKTPQDVRRKYRILDARLRRQSRINRNLLEEMLPLTLFNFLRSPDYLDHAMRSRRIGKKGRSVIEKIRKALPATGSFADFRRDSRDTLSGLAENEREQLVKSLEALAGWEEAKPRPGKAAEKTPPGTEEAAIPVFDEVVPGPVRDQLHRARGFFPVLPSRYRETRWALAVDDDANFPRFEKGDLVIFDEKAVARTGDVVAARLSEGGFLVGRFVKLDKEIEIAPANPTRPPRRFERGRGVKKGYVLRGVAVELIRTMRGN